MLLLPLSLVLILGLKLSNVEKKPFEKPQKKNPTNPLTTSVIFLIKVYPICCFFFTLQNQSCSQNAASF